MSPKFQLHQGFPYALKILLACPPEEGVMYLIISIQYFHTGTLVIDTELYILTDLFNCFVWGEWR